ncbi:OLC1v1014744C1 [Oldenlandia corymbosa var. corymbosa]|uniref:OLC1v1014744C1 n=1 Tax=Oldenlandia corymbosa var. corymbosa TaxID=529605 RepID=A0AAV1E561_OLDCO|nr:OLC1v1014744C1 [Oldenlandia corymbosa var. corymbosa]
MERCNSGNGDSCCGCCCWSRRHSSRDYDRFESDNVKPSRRSSKPSTWTQQLLRKIKREKKRMMESKSNATSMRFSYDPFSYSQNFDQGFTWADPDDLSRSFSARFAVPSRIFDKDV